MHNGQGHAVSRLGNSTGLRVIGLPSQCWVPSVHRARSLTMSSRRPPSLTLSRRGPRS
jgi:hypothetical protein